MTTHEFTLVLSGVAELTPELANALYEAMDGDIELNMRDGKAYLECRGQVPALRDAILAMIRQVEEARVGERVLRVESEAANTMTKIKADLLQATG